MSLQLGGPSPRFLIVDGEIVFAVGHSWTSILGSFLVVGIPLLVLDKKVVTAL